jgi:hypothetical protein
MSSLSAAAHALGEAPFFFFFSFLFAFTCDKQSMYLCKPQIDFNISQTTFINDKRPNMSRIHNILQTTHSKVHTISSSQVHIIPSSTISEIEIESNCK